MIFYSLLILPSSVTLFFTKYGLLGLFLNGMFSSFLPIPTEITTATLIAAKENETRVFIVLTVGSIIGGFIAYYIGYTGVHVSHRLRKITRFDDKRSQTGYALLARYGWILIFISPWIPIGGDIIPIIAGIKKYNLNKFIIAMALGKAIKALAIVYFLSLIVVTFFQH